MAAHYIFSFSDHSLETLEMVVSIPIPVDQHLVPSGSTTMPHSKLLNYLSSSF